VGVENVGRVRRARDRGGGVRTSGDSSLADGDGRWTLPAHPPERPMTSRALTSLASPPPIQVAACVLRRAALIPMQRVGHKERALSGAWSSRSHALGSRSTSRPPAAASLDGVSVVFLPAPATSLAVPLPTARPARVPVKRSYQL
jgi:hypothetical protein